jgi:hypothetical protein
VNRRVAAASCLSIAALVLALAAAASPRQRPADPAGVPAPPSYAIGFPSRAADLDVLPGFRNPPAGYGEVAFYWWMGGPLTKERLAWQLDRLAGKGVMGLQINYAHSDRGGQSWGLTYPSDPPLFSPPWWELTRWFLKEARRRGMAVSLSDYTLGIGQGWCIDEILLEHPELAGRVLRHQVRETGAGEFRWTLPAGTLMVAAYETASGSANDLRPHIAGSELVWRVPAGHWRVVAVVEQQVAASLDPMSPLSGAEYVRTFFGRWEDRNPGEAGKGLNFFFSDELGFGVSGNLWTPRFPEEFRKRKGYDLVPELPALFEDIGPRTPKVRLDYRDVMVSLEEESFFEPVFDWHQRRGMIFGCDHGGRGREVDEFGDYFRTQRWNQGPGSDQPNLSKDVIKAKVASSIAHLYRRPRVWLEGFHSSGWGTTSAQLADATFANITMGYNLLTLHGLYYSTRGGWWEWAPPDNHFHMPYWPHMGEFLEAVQRLSYLLSQGDHRCDVAIVYPVAATEAGMDGPASVRAAFGVGQHLYARGIDFDYMDFESLARATVVGRELHVSGETYRALVLPAMKAVRFSTIEKAVEFQRAGGLVILLGAVPEASDRAGRGDAELLALVGELRTRAAAAEQVEKLIEAAFPRDYSGPGAIMHRRIGPRDVYTVYGGRRGAESRFRATGKVELWDPWTGRTRPLPVLEQSAGSTRLSLPLSEREPQVIVFSEGAPTTDRPVHAETTTVVIDGDWEFELKPVLDNRWGDYHWPPTATLVGAEARQVRYAGEITPNPGWQDPAMDDTRWPKVTASFGPKFWKLGPLPEEFNGEALVGIAKVDPGTAVEFRGRRYRWQPYEFSWRWGIEGDPGHQGYHGLKGNVPNEFIALGQLRLTDTGSAYEKEEGGRRYYLWTSVAASRSGLARLLIGGNRPSSIWINHTPVGHADGRVEIKAGSNPLLLQYDQVGRGYVVADAGDPRVLEVPPTEAASPYWMSPLAMFWDGKARFLPFDTLPQTARPAGWYRFTAPPGLRSLSVYSSGNVRVWVNGAECLAAPGGRFIVSRRSASPVVVAIRVEQARGNYGGAALSDRILLDCGPGRIALGDWSRIDGLASYSGGAWYRKTVSLPPASRVVLDLGDVVATAEVRVNGKPAGLKVAPPWTLDISELAKPGANRIDVLVYNTLANHYSTIPTRYRGRPTSGLLGPVTLAVTRPGSPLEKPVQR